MTLDAPSKEELFKLGWPRALVSAIRDYHDYTVGLNSGLNVRFETADYLNPEWVRLHVIHESMNYPDGLLFSRTLDVKVSEICWAAFEAHASTYISQKILAEAGKNLTKSYNADMSGQCMDTHS